SDEKIMNVSYGHIIIDGSAWNGSDNTKNVVALIEKGIENGSVIKIKYSDKRGNETDREIEPHIIILKQGLWYVYAYCRLREEFRMFKASRILSADLTEKPFSRKDSDFSEQTVNAWFENMNAEYVDLEVDKRAKADVEEWLGVNSVYKNSEGKYFATAKLPCDSFLTSKILSFGGKVKVVSPQKLKDALKKTVAELTEIYG
ncbi:MAG: WYL domain-containing protein, partial [Clostridia bacterium]|nr:WYL domain-containing protein [Clostridia bacterium]